MTDELKRDGFWHSCGGVVKMTLGEYHRLILKAPSYLTAQSTTDALSATPSFYKSVIPIIILHMSFHFYSLCLFILVVTAPTFTTQTQKPHATPPTNITKSVTKSTNAAIINLGPKIFQTIK